MAIEHTLSESCLVKGTGPAGYTEEVVTLPLQFWQISQLEEGAESKNSIRKMESQDKIVFQRQYYGENIFTVASKEQVPGRGGVN